MTTTIEKPESREAEAFRRDLLQICVGGQATAAYSPDAPAAEHLVNVMLDALLERVAQTAVMSLTMADDCVVYDLDRPENRARVERWAQGLCDRLTGDFLARYAALRPYVPASGGSRSGA